MHEKACPAFARTVRTRESPNHLVFSTRSVCAQPTTSQVSTHFVRHPYLFPPSHLHSPQRQAASIFKPAIAMDPINNRDNLFSRGPSPPPQPHQHFGGPLLQPNDQHVSPAPSLREVAPAPAATHLDSLFHNLAAPSQRQPSPHPPTVNNNIYAGPQEAPASGPATPASVTAGSVASTGSAPNANTDRQNALLSLLGSVSPQGNVHQPNPQPISQAPPQQVPTPPGSAPRAGPSSNSESQGKFLLEQLMSGYVFFFVIVASRLCAPRTRNTLTRIRADVPCFPRSF